MHLKFFASGDYHETYPGCSQVRSGFFSEARSPLVPNTRTPAGPGVRFAQQRIWNGELPHSKDQVSTLAGLLEDSKHKNSNRGQENQGRCHPIQEGLIEAQPRLGDRR